MMKCQMDIKNQLKNNQSEKIKSSSQNLNKMEKYIIRVNVFESELNGIRNSSNFEYIFEENSLIESRFKAIKMVYELTTYLISGTENEFISLMQVQTKGETFFNAFTIELLFSPVEGVEYQIFGEEELMVPSLVKEADYYRKLDNPPLKKIFGAQGEVVEVLESNIDFFIN